ncbi:uncharacterized protein BCR38DRAFT_408624 [Pseudomassariella vexata]|uniref:Uncharacterized protein n=1 Tax=Pseudomassariella vexata TaxID=1141098 RepID=A0A1Y2E047_9PEZI|nr:uncharacterized protein BCR38DRAFT_408624 [Pseudomassariella vexata]ORY64859.1 hypothetical protein BCR38DRAFT_408624 [Pseudomassariella vexata]
MYAHLIADCQRKHAPANWDAFKISQSPSHHHCGLPFLKGNTDSVSVDDSASVSTNSAYFTDNPTVKAKRDDGKVDYVLVMDTSRSAKLQQVILRVASQDGGVKQAIAPLNRARSLFPLKRSQRCHSKTLYTNLVFRLPPGTNICTPSHSALGITGSGGAGGVSPLRLPLVQVVGHVCVFGSMTIGNTEDGVSTHVLLALLQALKNWVEGTSQEAMKKWLWLRIHLRAHRKPPRL